MYTATLFHAGVVRLVRACPAGSDCLPHNVVQLPVKALVSSVHFCFQPGLQCDHCLG